MEKPKQPQQHEQDDRFPSGPWKGFWIQQGGRGWMYLQLQFKEGRIDGQGKDRVGRFGMTGTYSTEDGKVELRKQYTGQHSVDYSGWAEIQHGIWGLWNILMSDKGGWQIWPEGREVGNAIQAHEEIPAEVEQSAR
jgi:hypothetical protein